MSCEQEKPEAVQGAEESLHLCMAFACIIGTGYSTPSKNIS